MKNDQEKLEELEKSCTSTQDELNLYKALVQNAMNDHNDDIVFAIREEYDFNYNHTPTEGDL